MGLPVYIGFCEAVAGGLPLRRLRIVEELVTPQSELVVGDGLRQIGRGGVDAAERLLRDEEERAGENSSQIIYGSSDTVLIYALFGKFPSSKSPIFHRHMLETQRCYSLTLTFEEESYIQMLN